jgi:hypothetical protein
MSVEQIQPKVTKVTEWPSKRLNVGRPEIDVGELGTKGIWKDAGTFDNHSLFHVRDCADRNFLIAVDTRGIFEMCGVTRTEVGRTEQSELIVMYWEQLMEQHRQKPRIFPVLELL